MSDDHDPNTYLVGFLTNFTLLIEKELLSIRQSVVLTVESVMAGIESISDTVQKNKLEADTVLEFTYLTPDVETEVLIEDIQSLADNFIEKVYQQLENGNPLGDTETSNNSEVLVQNRLNRFSTKLNNSVDKLATLDSNLSEKVFEIVGALSTEDLISQRLEHTILSLKSLQTGLSFILIDYEVRCQAEEIVKVVQTILDYTYRQYTAEEEKERFHKIFGKKSS